ncbi:MAG TPA: universal stress protein [Chloroflexia bacterium]|nr:universal stress protein [Chloroflexia bacterium]
MFKHIVVPLDGSELSEKALPYAVRLAKSLDLSLTLLRVVDVPDLPAVPLRKRHFDEVTEYLLKIRDFISGKRKDYLFLPRVEVAVVAGEPVSEICRFVREKEEALLIMTTHGRSGFSRLVMGSVAGRVLHKLTTPVLLVRPFGRKETYSLEELLSAEDEPFAITFLVDGIRLLVPLDQDEKSEAALDPAFELARQLKAPLYFVKVNLPVDAILYGEAAAFALSPEDIAKIEEHNREEAQAYLEQVVQLAQEQGLETNTEVLTGDPAKEIMEYADAVEPDLLVMATHARGEVGRFFFGSVATQILQSTHLPVLLVPPGKAHGKSGEARESSAGKEPVETQS